MKCPKCDAENTQDSQFCKKCATSLNGVDESQRPITKTIETPREELTTGSTFAGRYQIIEELGKGGMGKVYRALDKKLNEEVALKLIKPDIASDKNTIERFKNELKLARKIRQKNVGSMYELLEDNGIHYITMGYVSGQDLKGLIRQTGQLTVGKAISIAKQICDGLSEAHNLGVVHRDLKPNNIMIDRGGNAKIMDFGIARAVKGKSITGSGVAIGTPQYMSPEQVEGKDVDQRADIYSLGIILYEMLTTRVPFEGDTPLTVGVKQKTETPKAPQDFNERIPDALNRLILKCLEKDKENRYQNAAELRSDLDKLEQGLPTTDRVIPKKKTLTPREFTVQFSVKKLFFPVIAVITILVIGLFLLNPWSRQKSIPFPTDKHSLAIFPFDNVSGDENLDFWRDGIAELFTTDLMQSKFLNVLTRDRVLGILERLNLDSAKSYRTEDLIKVAEEGGVNHTVTGSFIKAGENILLTVTLQNPHTGEVIDSHRETCNGEADIPIKVDILTRRIKSKLDLTQEQIDTDFDKAVGKITTNSPEAFKYFLEGNRYYNIGNTQKSIESLEKAISIDPEFAMAFVVLGMNYQYGFAMKKEGGEYLEKAFELSDRLSEKELVVIRGQYFGSLERTYDKALEAFNELSELYPDHEYVNRAQGWLYLSFEDWDKAIEHLKLHIQNDVTPTPPYTNLASSYLQKGQYKKAEAVLDYYLTNISNNDIVRLCLARTYYSQKKYDLALSEISEAFSYNPDNYDIYRYRGDIYLYKGNFSDAENEFKKLLELTDPAALQNGNIGLTCLYLVQGKYEKAIDQANQAVEKSRKFSQQAWKSDWHLTLAYLKSDEPEDSIKELDKAWAAAVEIDDLTLQKRTLHAQGLILLKIKDVDQAQKKAEAIETIIEQNMNKKHLRYYLHLMGMIAMNKKDVSEAIDYFERAVALLPAQNYTDTPWNKQALFIDSLALAQYKSGDFEKSIRNYTKITNLTTGRLYCGDIYVKSFYMLGKIFEQQDETAKAIEHYQKFLDLWKNADPGLPEVAAARERVAGFKE